MFLSIVILSFNSSRHIEKCLSHVFDSLKCVDKEAEVFVVENGSSDGSLTIIDGFHKQFPDVLKLIKFEGNTGTTYSRNAALRQAKGDFILVLDSDAYITADAISKLTHYLAQTPAVGMTALTSVDKPTEVDYAISACWMLSRRCFESVGLLDEKIFYSPEDVDYCLRVWEAGFVITYLPSVSVVHDAQELSRGFKLTRFHFSHLKGLLYLMFKHKYFWGLSSLYKRLGKDS